MTLRFSLGIDLGTTNSAIAITDLNTLAGVFIRTVVMGAAGEVRDLPL